MAAIATVPTTAKRRMEVVEVKVEGDGVQEKGVKEVAVKVVAAEEVAVVVAVLALLLWLPLPPCPLIITVHLRLIFLLLHSLSSLPLQWMPSFAT